MNLLGQSREEQGLEQSPNILFPPKKQNKLSENTKKIEKIEKAFTSTYKKLPVLSHRWTVTFMVVPLNSRGHTGPG